LGWPEADRLRELATTIRKMQQEFGGSNRRCEEFLRLCRLHGANDPGEPKLAAAFLAQLQKSQIGLPEQIEKQLLRANGH
jgi:hypothetical protein